MLPKDRANGGAGQGSESLPITRVRDHARPPTAGDGIVWGMDRMVAGGLEPGIGMLPGQEMMWRFCRVHPDVPALNLAWRLHLPDGVCPGALLRVAQDVVGSHDALRVVCADGDGRVRQRFLTEARVDVPMVGAPGLDGDAFREWLDGVGRDFCAWPYVPGQGPLVRFLGVLSAGRPSHLFFGAHHLVCDGPSWLSLATEIVQRLQGRAMGRGPSFRDFCAGEHEWLKSSEASAHATFWEGCLGEIAAIQGGRPRRVTDGANGFGVLRAAMVLPAEVIAALAERCRVLGTTRFRLMMAACLRYFGERDGWDEFVLGTTLAARGTWVPEGLVGAVGNRVWLPFRAMSSGDWTEAVHEGVDAAIRHSRYPFAAALTGYAGGLGAHVLGGWRVSFNQLPGRRRGPEHPADVIFKRIFADSCVDDLALYVSPGETGCEVSCLSRIRTVAPEDILEGFCDSLKGLLAGASGGRGGGARVSGGRPVAGMSARADLERSLCDAFASVVARAPDRPAVRAGGDTWTYGEIDRLSDGVARRLRKRGSSADGRAALLFEAGPLPIICMLGVLKAGWAYVPMDASWPARRVRGVLEDSECHVLLASRAMIDRIELPPGCAVDALDIGELGPCSGGGDSGSSRVAPDAIAYVLYTSGSTGRPKGVVQNHRNVLYHALTYSASLSLSEEDRVSLLAPVAFDAAVMDIFGALFSGATLCLWDVRARGLAGLAEWVGEAGISVLHLTPSLFRALTDLAPEPAVFRSVRVVVLGGEEVTAEDTGRFLRWMGESCALANGYGPSESTLATQYWMTRQTVPRRGSAPIGYPVAGTGVVLLGKDGAETSGEGEIGIFGEHVALGYRNREDLTRQVFSPMPGPGMRRLYRTGDIGRRDSEGRLWFVGRREGFLKIRGLRIETGEIESVIRGHPGVADATVIGVPRGKSGYCLVAFWVSVEGGSVTDGELRGYVRERLPSWMVPARWARVEALPLTANGKRDRNALADRAQDVVRQKAAPRNDGERLVVRLIEETLGIQGVGAQEDFISLGGDSLGALQLLARIERETGRVMPPSLAAEDFTANSIAGILEAGVSGVRGWSVLREGERGAPIFMVPGHGGGSGCYLELARLLQVDSAVIGLRLRGLDDRCLPDESFEVMGVHLADEIRAVQPAGPYQLVGYSLGGMLAFEVARQLQASGGSIGAICVLDTYPLNPMTFLPFEVWCRRWWARMRVHWRNASARAPRGFIRYFGERLFGYWHNLMRIRRGAPLSPTVAMPDAVPSGMGRFNQAFVRARWRYRPRPCDVAVTIFRTPAFGTINMHDPIDDWRRLARGGVVVVDVPGEHFGLLELPAVQVLAERLTDHLRETMRSRPR